jgi:hypothetical protein
MDNNERKDINRVIDEIEYLLNLTQETSSASIITMYKETRKGLETSMKILCGLIE